MRLFVLTQTKVMPVYHSTGFCELYTNTLGKSSNRSPEKSNNLAKISKIREIPLSQENGVYKKRVSTLWLCSIDLLNFYLKKTMGTPIRSVTLFLVIYVT